MKLAFFDDFKLGVVKGDSIVDVSAVETLESVAAAARRLGCRASVHLEADIGQGRGGAVPADWPRLFAWSHCKRSLGICARECSASSSP